MVAEHGQKLADHLDDGASRVQLRTHQEMLMQIGEAGLNHANRHEERSWQVERPEYRMRGYKRRDRTSQGVGKKRDLNTALWA